MEYQPIKRYLDIVVKKIKENKTTNLHYFDYDFVTRFILPDLTGIRISASRTPTSSMEKRWAKKLLWLYDQSSQNCDDCIPILFNFLMLTGYITECNYICASINVVDMKKYYPRYKYGTFETVLVKQKTLAKSIAKIRASQPTFLTSYISNRQFIDNRMFYLSVGNWSINISPRACDLKYVLSEEYDVFMKPEDGKYYLYNKKTGTEECLSKSRKMCPDLIKILEQLSERKKNYFGREDEVEVFGIDYEIYFKKVKNDDSPLDNVVRGLRHFMKEDFEDLFNVDNGLYIKNNGVPVIKKIYTTY